MPLDAFLRFFAPFVGRVAKSTRRLELAQDTPVANDVLLARVLGLETSNFRGSPAGLVFRKGRSGPFTVGTSAAQNRS